MTKHEAKIRRTIFIGAVLAVGVAVCSSFCRKPSAEEFEVTEVVIHSGDTLWGIAEEYAPNSMDIRDYIYLMYKLNDGLTPNIQPGTGIIIPVC